jgi:hypothetical protein
MINNLFKEKWTQYAALATTIFAVCASISALKGGGYSTKVQMTTTKEANSWGYFQAKSIKQHMSELHLDQLDLEAKEERDTKIKALIDDKIKTTKDDVARYDKEKSEIKEQAEALGKSTDGFKKHAGYFGLAVMLLQISIMLNSIGVLVKKRRMWALGLSFGIIGVIYMFVGLFL